MIRFIRIESRKYMIYQLIWFILWVIITGLLIYMHPNRAGHGTHTQLGLPPCGSVLMFGRPCPACGLTTSWSATVHLNFVKAWTSHPFGTLFYLIYTLSAIGSIVGWVKGYYMETRTKAFNITMGTLIVLYLAYGIYRFCTVSYWIY